MDVDAVTGNSNLEMDMGGGQWEYPEWEVPHQALDYVSKGKNNGN